MTVEFRNVATAQRLAQFLPRAGLSAVEILNAPLEVLRECYFESFNRIETFRALVLRRSIAEANRRARIKAQADAREKKLYHNPLEPSLNNRLCWTMDAIELLKVRADADKKRAALFGQANEIINSYLSQERAERRVRLKLSQKLREQKRLERLERTRQ